MLALPFVWKLQNYAQNRRQHWLQYQISKTVWLLEFAPNLSNTRPPLFKIMDPPLMIGLLAYKLTDSLISLAIQLKTRGGFYSK